MTSKLRPAATPEQHLGYYGNKPIKSDVGFGGFIRTKDHMKPPAKIPCRECPLRRDAAPGFLGGYTPEMYIAVLHSPASLACHCSKGFHTGEIGKQRHCTGVAGYRANVGILRGAAADTATRAMENYPRDLTEDFFSSPEEFYAHHKPGQTTSRQDGNPYPLDWGHDQDDEL
jgi:hypothetical protein